MEHEFNPTFNGFMSIVWCLLLSAFYLASLHVWNSPFNRDHPSTIKQRFISCIIMLFIAPCFLYIGLDKSILNQATFLEVLGLRVKGLLPAIVIPLLLTMVLFLGPMFMEFFSGTCHRYAEVSGWLPNLTNLMWIRNRIVAPLSEEFTYRSCMMPLLLQCLPPMTAVLINPLFFGISHLHHIHERIKYDMNCKEALLISGFQFSYTTIFGAYSAYLFYRTGHYASVFVVHAFCNHMGFPNITEIPKYPTGKKIIVCCLFVLGFVSWCFLITPLTKPSWYHNSPKYARDSLAVNE
ncbi:CAAX prenyl protease 2 [Dendroctonus ponderosae]|uniref:CAAX prenyl protease 2 n=1 Tax=Dendroctonus ponderosae TaxID=77166 RepID=J3JUN2_DENPD|nr:CAAX prenyl protease 2 [Dendroctonus ponderosae]AEE61909.1 unknown [Dendroctonus ponderosae]